MRFVKAGTVERLVEALATDDGELESTYVNVFLATYRYVLLTLHFQMKTTLSTKIILALETKILFSLVSVVMVIDLSLNNNPLLYFLVTLKEDYEVSSSMYLL